MDWKELFLILIEHNQLDIVINSINNNVIYKLDNFNIVIEPLKKGEIKGVKYDFKSDKMFAVTFDDETISASHNFVLDSIESQKLNQDLLNTGNTSFTFFDFQFVLYMGLSADISSGFTHFRSSVKQISNSFEKGKANLNGIELANDGELDEYLTKTINGYKSLFKSVMEIKNYA